jgi:hypothetical protein
MSTKYEAPQYGVHTESQITTMFLINLFVAYLKTLPVNQGGMIGQLLNNELERMLK